MIINPRKIIQNTFFLPFPLIIIIIIIIIMKRITKTPYHEMHKCYAIQILKKKKKKKKREKKKKQQRRMVTKSREMKYKGHARKLQLD